MVENDIGIILLAIICGCIAAIIAYCKGGSLIWSLAGLLLGPLGIVLTVFLARPRCHNCKSRIHKDAKVCLRCGEPQNTDSDPDQTSAPLVQEKRPGDPF